MVLFLRTKDVPGRIRHFGHSVPGPCPSFATRKPIWVIQICASQSSRTVVLHRRNCMPRAIGLSRALFIFSPWHPETAGIRARPDGRKLSPMPRSAHRRARGRVPCAPKPGLYPRQSPKAHLNAAGEFRCVLASALRESRSWSINPPNTHGIGVVFRLPRFSDKERYF